LTRITLLMHDFRLLYIR